MVRDMGWGFMGRDGVSTVRIEQLKQYVGGYQYLRFVSGTATVSTKGLQDYFKKMKLSFLILMKITCLMRMPLMEKNKG